MGITGRTIVFTGRVSKPRHEFQALVEKHGGIASPDISKNTDYLVIGEKPGSKLFRATLLGIKIITEEELLKLLSPTETDETPLTSKELAELETYIVKIECTWCHQIYKQWDNLPNYETCPVCEILSHPICPHCSNEPIFVTNFGLYHCLLCGTWFKAPFSPHARQTEHLHLWLVTKNPLIKKCPCGASIPSTQSKKNYEEAPSLVKKWSEENMALQKIRLERAKEIYTNPNRHSKVELLECLNLLNEAAQLVELNELQYLAIQDTIRRLNKEEEALKFIEALSPKQIKEVEKILNAQEHDI